MPLAHVSELESIEEQTRQHTSLIENCCRDGMTFQGLEPKVLSGKGVGLVTNRKITQGELLISVPARSLITIDSQLFRGQRELLKGLSVQGQLAALLVFPSFVDAYVETTHRLWLSVLPSVAELQAALPMFWHFTVMPQNTAQSVGKISPQMEKMVHKQVSRFKADLNVAQKNLFPFCAQQASTTFRDVEERFKRGWLLVNTRSFYWDLAKKDGRGHKRRKIIKDNSNPSKVLSNDFMALCPVIDYLNHAHDEGCEVSFNADGYTIRARRDHEPGEELTVSYGKHANDYLLVEYGFALSKNPADSTTVDHILLPTLNEEQKELLQRNNLLGGYIISHKGEPCHRTACALRLRVFESVQLWTKYVKGKIEEEIGGKEANKLLHDDLKQYAETTNASGLKDSIERSLGNLPNNVEPDEAFTFGENVVLLLSKRWTEIYEILEKCIQNLNEKGSENR